LKKNWNTDDADLTDLHGFLKIIDAADFSIAI